MLHPDRPLLLRMSLPSLPFRTRWLIPNRLPSGFNCGAHRASAHHVLAWYACEGVKEVLIKLQNVTASLTFLKASGFVASAPSVRRILWCAPPSPCRCARTEPSQSCVLCPNEGGAFKQTVNGDWIHLLCAMWIPETQVVNETVMEPIANLDRVNKARYRLVRRASPFLCALLTMRRNAASARSRIRARASNAIGPAASLPSMLPALASTHFFYA